MHSHTRLTVAALFAFNLVTMGTALAQTAPPAAAPTPSCEKPGDPPRIVTTETGREVAERQRNAWAIKTKAYVECLKRFVDEERAMIEPHIKAMNAALEDYNQAIKTYNEQAQAGRN